MFISVELNANFSIYYFNMKTGDRYSWSFERLRMLIAYFKKNRIVGTELLHKEIKKLKLYKQNLNGTVRAVL